MEPGKRVVCYFAAGCWLYISNDVSIPIRQTFSHPQPISNPVAV
jgi:hypothetical protein